NLSRCLKDPAAIACFSRTIARVRRIAQALIPAIPLVRIGLIQDVTRRDQEASADQRATAGVFNQSNWCSWHDGGRRKVTFVVLAWRRCRVVGQVGIVDRASLPWRRGLPDRLGWEAQFFGFDYLRRSRIVHLCLHEV